MEDKPFCVYNRTNESFVSLGVTFAGGFALWLKEWFGRAPRNGNEGRWLIKLPGVWTLGLFGSRDLLYLDSELRVLDIAEAFPAFQFAPATARATSILELPANSIALSKTKVGHQLVICAANEMEFQLRRMTECTSNASGADAAEGHEFRGSLLETRRGSPRVRWPRLVAYDAAASLKAAHGVRDISASGLYLMTEERWAIGSPLRMTLQRAYGAEEQRSTDDHSVIPIVVDLKVARWGEDGMGLEFMRIDAERIAVVAMHD